MSAVHAFGPTRSHRAIHFPELQMGLSGGSGSITHCLVRHFVSLEAAPAAIRQVQHDGVSHGFMEGRTGMIASESKEFSLSWLPEIEDYYEAFRADALARGVRWKSAVLYVPGLAAFIIGAFSHQWVVVGLGLVVALYGMLMSPMYPLQIQKLWRRSAAMRDLTRWRVVAGEGLIAVTVPGSAAFDWSRFCGVLETDRVFVLQMTKEPTGLWRFHPGRRILVLAKRGLDSAGDVPRLLELLSQETRTAA